MTTPNADLAEQIARVLNAEGWTFEGEHEPGEYDECAECRSAVDPIAAAVLPIVDAAVKRGQAEALRDAAQDYGPAQISGLFLGADGYTKAWLARRADLIEKETPDEQ